MKRSLSRRDFMGRAAAAGIALPAVAVASKIAHGYPANSKVRHAGIGVQGMGGHDLGQIASHPELEVAFICDIDDRHLDQAAKQYPNAKRYNDFRELFDKEHSRIDSCHVTVPDHMHAPIT
ncbi:MAG TPA: twin-arginine translocation signal domain-containing protein, partial [Planctomycetota bacterium]|nr:twin-arginine translocation signal domain-containing protein [Planctomycetota bacterium]